MCANVARMCSLFHLSNKFFFCFTFLKLILTFQLNLVTALVGKHIVQRWQKLSHIKYTYSRVWIIEENICSCSAWIYIAVILLSDDFIDKICGIHKQEYVWRSFQKSFFITSLFKLINFSQNLSSQILNAVTKQVRIIKNYTVYTTRRYWLWHTGMQIARSGNNSRYAR